MRGHTNYLGKSVLLNNTLKATKIQVKYHEDATKYSRKVKKYDQQNTSSISLVTPGPLTRHEKVRIWAEMDELTLKIGLFHHEFNDEVDVLQSWKCREFSENTGKSLILRYWSGFKAYFGPDLVRIGTKKWSGIGLQAIIHHPLDTRHCSDYVQTAI